MDVLGLDERRVGNRCGNVGGHPGRGIYVGGAGWWSGEGHLFWRNLSKLQYGRAASAPSLIEMAISRISDSAITASAVPLPTIRPRPDRRAQRLHRPSHRRPAHRHRQHLLSQQLIPVSPWAAYLSPEMFRRIDRSPAFEERKLHCPPTQPRALSSLSFPVAAHSSSGTQHDREHWNVPCQGHPIHHPLGGLRSRLHSTPLSTRPRVYRTTLPSAPNRRTSTATRVDCSSSPVQTTQTIWPIHRPEEA